MHSNAFVNKVDVIKKTYTITPNGQTVDSWQRVNSLWACILEIDTAIFQSYVNFSNQKLVKIIFKGRRKFNVEETYFRYKTTVYKLLMQSMLHSRTDTQYTVVHCHEVDGVLDEAEVEDIMEAE